MTGIMGRLIAVVGPTGAGKSALGLRLAERLHAGIACCDSVQVYRGFDIGSAKPSAEDRRRIRHRLVDVCDPEDPWTAGDHGQALVEHAHARAPWICVGGTGFYLRSAVWALDSPPPEDQDLARRSAFDAKWLAHERAEEGAVHRALSAVDPDTACEIHPRNVVRAMRALWLCEIHGEPVSQRRRRHPPTRRLDLLLIEVDPGVEEVDQRIDARCDQMVAAGWIDEVEMLRNQGYDAHLRPMQSLGYKQINEHLAGRGDLASTVDDIKSATRAYARRQRTFFRHQFPEATTLRISGGSPQDLETAVDASQRFLDGAPK